MISSAYKIRPHYRQIMRGESMPSDTWNKWICFYHEQVGDLNISRYMSPNGWQPTAYYFNDKREAEQAFIQHGWKSLPVTSREIQDARMIRDDMRRMMDADLDLEIRGMERDTWESERGMDV